MRIWTYKTGEGASPGALIETHKIGDLSIPCLKVGEEGRSRQLGILPVIDGEPGKYLLSATPERPRSSKWVLHAGVHAEDKRTMEWHDPKLEENGKIIVVLRPKHGYRGGCTLRWIDGDEEKIAMPDRVLCAGNIAQGIAGGLGYAPQRILILPEGAELRIRRSGRLYGDPASTYIRNHGGKKITALTKQEREVLALLS